MVKMTAFPEPNRVSYQIITKPRNKRSPEYSAFVYNDEVRLSGRFYGKICSLDAYRAALADFFLKETKHIVPNFLTRDSDHLPTNTLFGNYYEPLPFNLSVHRYSQVFNSTEDLMSLGHFGFNPSLFLRLDNPVFSCNLNLENCSQKPTKKYQLTSSELKMLEETSRNLFTFGEDLANSHGLQLISANFHFGLIKSPQGSNLVVTDEILTPETSLYYDPENYITFGQNLIESLAVIKPSLTVPEITFKKSLKNTDLKKIKLSYSKFYNIFLGRKIQPICHGKGDTFLKNYVESRF